ncbi:MAG TPA: hypothetical protein VGE07_26770 [Herpetosiphonaceae bacterium]
MTPERFAEDEREAGGVQHDVGGTAAERAEINREDPLAERLNPEGGEYVDRSAHTPPPDSEPTDHAM